MRSLHVLIVGDSDRDSALLTQLLSQAGYDVNSRIADSREEMHSALLAREWDVILCTRANPPFNAPCALALLRETGLDLPFIVITDSDGETQAVEAMAAGAHDYLLRDRLTRLAPAIKRERTAARDRCARRRAEIEPREREERFRSYFHLGLIGMAITSPTKGLVEVNDYICESLGYTREELLRKTWAELTVPEDLGNDVAEFERVLAGELDGYSIDKRYLRKDGEIIHATISVQCLRRPDGSIEYFLAMLQDITARKRAEAEQRRLNAEIESQRVRLNNVVASVPGLVWETWNLPDPAAQRVDFVSDYVEVMLGYTVEEWLSRPDFWLTIVHPEDQERTRRSLAANRAVGAVVKREFRWITKDGRVIWVESTSTVIADDNGHRIGLRGVTVEITERRHAERELRQSEERYRELVENAHDIIYTHDLLGNYTSVNQAVERITGFSREEALRMNLAHTVAPEYLEKAKKMVARKLAGEKVTAYDIEIFAKDGHRIAFEINIRIVREDGVPIGVQGIARDVTERRQLEEQLRQSQKMEAVGQLAGGIAHDFNNLLTVISGHSELSLNTLKAGDPLRYNLEEIRKAGSIAATLTRQLLAFSRKQVLQPKVFELNAVIVNLERMLGRLIGEDIVLRTELSADLGNVKADPGQIEQVLMNLALNARDAMPQGGNLTLETRNVEFGEEMAGNQDTVSRGSYVGLFVTDTGVGMDHETQTRIFEPFFTTKEFGEATGLGLSTAYGIIKQSGGHVAVESELGVGTTVKVYLPRIAEEAEDYHPGADADGLMTGTETILIAEDEELVRKLVVQSLEMCGYRVLDAANGGAALLICEKYPGPIHLLLTDVIMPEMSGRELADRLAPLRPEMRVLFMSGYTDDVIGQQGVLEAGANFIEKPFTPDALAQKVRLVIDK